MIKLDHENINVESYLNDDDLKSELFALAEKNNLPERIILKTYNKLKEKNIKINNDQLTALISRFSREIKNFNVDNKTEFEKSNFKESFTSFNNTENNLIESLKNIGNRMDKLEKYYANICKNNYFDRNLNVKYSSDTTKDDKIDLDIVKLTQIPMDARSIVILMKWLQYLVDQLGKSQVSDVLNFYVDVGWITEDIKFDLLKYIKGLTDINKEQEGDKGNRIITSKEHIHSLLFIQKLKGKNMDDFLWKIDQDLDKFFKNIENHYSNQTI